MREPRRRGRESGKRATLSDRLTGGLLVWAKDDAGLCQAAAAEAEATPPRIDTDTHTHTHTYTHSSLDTILMLASSPSVASDVNLQSAWPSYRCRYGLSEHSGLVGPEPKGRRTLPSTVTIRPLLLILQAPRRSLLTARLLSRL